MRAARFPLVVGVALALLLLTVGATAIGVEVSRRGPGFSFAESTRGGHALLIAPAVLCLTAGLSRLWRHPDRLVGGVMVAVAGIAWVVGEWDNPGTSSALVFSVGLSCFAAAPAVVLHVAIGGPRGRLDGWSARVLVGLGYAVTLGVQGVLAAAAFDPPSSGCPSCPDNLWHVGGFGAASTSLDRFGVGAGLLWSALAVVAVLATAVRVSAARRRAEALRWLPAGVFLGLTVASYGHSLDRGFLGADVLDRRLWAAQALALAALALGALAELVRERAAERALARVVIDLSTASGSLRTALADRLGDPGLVLAFPVDRGGAFVDEAARPVRLDEGHDRTVTPLTYGGELLATLVHRTGVLAGRDAVEDLVGTIHLGLEHERLRAQALAQVAELRASGVRLVETGDEERRRLERDLHDGAQQRLVGLALGVRLLATRSEGSSVLPLVAEELQAAIDELRSLAAGLAPLVLTDAGLGPAVRALGEARDLRLTGAPAERFTPVVESTAYLAIERASATGPATVSLRSSGERLSVCVMAVGDPPSLDDVADRCTTLGGELTVTRVPDGHRVDVVLPLAVRA